MTVLDRSELQASPLADLHLIADQIGLEGFRRLRKADLIDAILGEQGERAVPRQSVADEGDGARSGRARRSRARSRRSESAAREDARAEDDQQQDDQQQDDQQQDDQQQEAESRPAGRRGRGRRTADVGDGRERGAGAGGAASAPKHPSEHTAEGVVEILGNGSAFLRIDPPAVSDQDVYISAAQVRRCELVFGDRVAGPVRTPRRSERYPSLIRIETINGQAADAVAEGTRYEDMPAAWPTERIAFGSEDPTLKAIEWLTPLGWGSRALIVGASRSGKTEALRRILAALAAREDLEVMLVLAGARPEEIQESKDGPLVPHAALHFAASADAQGQAVEAAIDTAKRLAARGGHAVVLIDGLDGVHPHTARKALAAARSIADGGSLTVIATASRPFGGETTLIALDAALAASGRFPAVDLLASGTLRAELLVGEQGAQEIARARAAAAG